MTVCNNSFRCFEFSQQEINETTKSGKLLTLEIEFSLRCNFHCQFCYIPNSDCPKDELTKQEIKETILQAKELGAKKIIILGGEPMVYPHNLELIKFIKNQGMKVEMFTNGYQISVEVAKQLLNYGVHVVLKINSFNENIQDMLTGQKGASKIMWEALHNLRSAGYPSNDRLLSVSTVICKQNVDELLNMWQWLREQNINPYFEMLTPQGRAKQNEWLNVNSSIIYELFRKIAEIDRSHYGLIWDPQPPLISNKCLRHQYSCLVNSQGHVMPCVGIPISLGNIKESKLSDILKESEVVEDLRNYRNTIKGPCRSCEKAESCYGCRGAAYQLTGDYLASDPLCWKNIDRNSEIVFLPVTVNGLIPQQSPMRIIDTLERVGERTAETSVTIRDDMPFIKNDKTIDGIVYAELLAQSIAALNGFKELTSSDKKTEGFLLGAKNLEILGKARVGDKLRISVFKHARFGDFGIIKGTVSRNGELLAQGEIKIWHNTSNHKQEALKDISI